MGVITFGLIMIDVILLAIFFIFKPDYGDDKAMGVFNWSVIGFGLILAAGAAIKFMGMNVVKGEEELQKAFATVAALAIFGVVLFIMFLIRNFWIFRVSRHPKF